MKLTVEELRGLFLFEKLDDEKLAWLAEHGTVETAAAGATVYSEGDVATCFYVLLEGTVTLSALVNGDHVEFSRSSQRGSYAGATQAYVGETTAHAYPHSMHAITDLKLWVLPAETFAGIMRDWFPMAVHLLEGLFVGQRAASTVVGERQRLLALGALSAGLTHELNNPAAAAVRATEALRGRVAGMRDKLARIADGRMDGSRLHELVRFQDDAVKRAAHAEEMSPLATSDAEDELGDWLSDHGVEGGWDLAGTLVAGDIDAEWLSRVTAAVGDDYAELAVRYITYTVDTELLMKEIDDAVRRISGLVKATKQYSQLDRAPYQTVDVHELLWATLTMIKSKIPPGITLVKDVDKTLPPVPAYAAELNQVWTNLLDNAVGAMGESGTLSIKTEREADCVVVEIGDTGHGIPPENLSRIFEPFFTTKPVGEGTGLGLDISYRIVVNKHGGDIRVTSKPGDTRFRVYLPLTPRPGA
ncbi:signal transduction histidine kinase [Catenuloplanes nepalensis]|uniref:histidine kinase n=1 Tax=Catenuloplanes nepalensis TaxID=587533 RepID=A0ABT9MWV8_9ACTN|nr:ATP-binding protein [Catenuloplanes nepalensis]MDP9795924.1 signal transduction histidine kinase [Catenuloplanes nepalensis]